MWSILENVPCALEKNVYSSFFGCNILKLSVKSNCSVVSLSISVALLILCLEDLSIDVSGVLKSPTIIVFLSISPFMSVSICFMYLGAPILGAYMLTSVKSSSCIDLLSLYSVLLYLSLWLCFKVYFVWYKYCDPHFLVISICMKYLFHSLTFNL